MFFRDNHRNYFVDTSYQIHIFFYPRPCAISIIIFFTVINPQQPAGDASSNNTVEYRTLSFVLFPLLDALDFASLVSKPIKSKLYCILFAIFWHLKIPNDIFLKTQILLVNDIKILFMKMHISYAAYFLLTLRDKDKDQCDIILQAFNAL